MIYSDGFVKVPLAGCCSENRSGAGGSRGEALSPVQAACGPLDHWVVVVFCGLSFFCHHRSHILLLSLHSAAFHPSDMGVCYGCSGTQSLCDRGEIGVSEVLVDITLVKEVLQSFLFEAKDINHIQIQKDFNYSMQKISAFKSLENITDFNPHCSI